MSAGFALVDELLVDPRGARIYEHGWQSWSPTALYDAAATSARPRLGWQQVMRFRPGTHPPMRGFQGEGLLAVDPGDGGPVRVYAGIDPTVEVPSIRAELTQNRILVSANADIATTESGHSIGDALIRFADEQARLHLPSPLRPAPTVWCSWYEYFLQVSESAVLENLDAMARRQLPVDVVQIDDGWQRSVGDWLELSPRFSSLTRLADQITAAGRRPGLWLAPFLATHNSDLTTHHPEWLIDGDAGFNWDQPLRGVDLTHPRLREYLWTALRRLREAGFDYFKLDFLYAGALPGPRYGGLAPIPAYRSGLELIRDAVGEAAYIVGCGAPMLSSIGLVDAMRVSPDTFNPQDPEDTENPLRGRAGVEGRAWQQGRLWVNDADCLVARPSFTRREEWAAVVGTYSGLRSFSDRIDDLDHWGLETVRRTLSTGPGTAPFDHLPHPYSK